MLNKNDLHDIKKLITFELHKHMMINEDYARSTTTNLMAIWRKLDEMINVMEKKNGPDK